MTQLDDIRDKAEATIEDVKNMTPEDLEAGAELVAEAVAGKVDKVASEIASMTPGDVEAGVELAAEAVENAVRKATE